MNRYNLADSRSPHQQHLHHLHTPIHSDKTRVHSITNVGIAPGEAMLSGLSAKLGGASPEFLVGKE
jgi:hypothetical protein